MNIPTTSIFVVDKAKLGQRLAGTAVIAASLFLGSAMAGEGTVAAVQIAGLHQKDGQGIYDQVFAAVKRDSGEIIQSQTLAPNRAFQEFESGNLDCISPANTNKNFYQFSFATTQSAPMSIAMVYIFTKAGSAPISDLAALKGKKVGVRSGMPYGNKVEGAGLNLVKARTIEANIKKLANNRIDAFIAYVPDAYAAFESLGVERLPHAVDAPIAVHEDALLCRVDKGGEDIVASFNKALVKLEASGELANIVE